MGKINKTKKVPKLRRLLRRINACPAARLHTYYMTLEEAWTFQDLPIYHEIEWKAFLLFTANRANVKYKANYKDDLILKIPKKLPVAFKKWCGYERRKNNG